MKFRNTQTLISNSNLVSTAWEVSYFPASLWREDFTKRGVVSSYRWNSITYEKNSVNRRSSYEIKNKREKMRRLPRKLHPTFLTVIKFLNFSIPIKSSSFPLTIARNPCVILSSIFRIKSRGNNYSTEAENPGITFIFF